MNFIHTFKDWIKGYALFWGNIKNEREQGWVWFALWGASLLLGGWWISGVGRDTLLGMLKWVAYVFLYAAQQLLTLSGNFLEYVLGPEFTNRTLTGDTNFVLMWGNMRDLTNMLIILAFVFVGIATTLRLRDYEAKKLLLPLILVALLINFSGLMCETIYGTANTVQNAFLKNGGAGGVQVLVGSLSKMVASIDTDHPDAGGDGIDEKDLLKLLQQTTGILIIICFATFTFTILAILLAFRYGVLVVFYILSPLAMFCYVFPFTKKFFSQWWSEFIRWNFIGVIAGFLIYLAASSFPTGDSPQAVYYFVSFVFIYMAYSFAKKGAAIGSGAILGLAGATAGYAFGAVGKVAQTAGKQLAGSRLGQATRQGATRIGESVGMVSPGTANLQQQKNLQEHKSEERAKTWDSTQTKNIATGGAMSRNARNDKVEAIKKMADDHRFGELSPDQARSSIAYAQGQGVSVNALAEKDYRAAQYISKKVEDYKKNNPTIPIAGGGSRNITDADAEKAIKIEQLEANLPSMKRKQLQSIDVADLRDNYNVVKDNFTPNMVKQFRTADRERINALKNHLGAVGAAGTLADDIQQARAAGNIREVDRLTKIHDAINNLP